MKGNEEDEDSRSKDCILCRALNHPIAVQKDAAHESENSQEAEMQARGHLSRLLGRIACAMGSVRQWESALALREVSVITVSVFSRLAG